MRQAIPIPAQILAGIVLWLTTLWEIPFCLLLAQKISTFLMLVIHVGIYSILSTSVSLKPWFALFPGAITSRLMCVVIKVMPNGLPFEPGQVTYSPELGRVSGLLIGIPCRISVVSGILAGRQNMVSKAGGRMTKRVMGSVRAELLKMKHTFLIPLHVAVPVIIAGFMLFYYRGTIGNPMGQTMAYFELIGIGFRLW